MVIFPWLIWSLQELRGLQASHSLELERLREELGRERELHREARMAQATVVLMVPQILC